MDDLFHGSGPYPDTLEEYDRNFDESNSHDKINTHRRTVCRSTGDRKRMLAGRLSDKMSGEPGRMCFFIQSRVFVFRQGGT